MEIEMTLKGYLPDPITNMPVIVLREVGGERILPIWVGKPEGDAIALQLEGVQPPRPLTHDLLKTVIEELGGHLDRVVVCDLKDNTFYATLHVLSPSGPRMVDARPSDAIALAQRSGARIFVEEAVIEKAHGGETSHEPAGAGRLDRLERWLANLSDDDLGKYKM